MNATTPISVVIPAFNAEEFIAESIASVQTQTAPVGEIIVVDDGSTDRTADIARGMGAVVTHQPHAGISAARNVGIRAARFEWIALQDADDLWHPRKIEYQWAAIQRYTDVGLVSCDSKSFYHGQNCSELFSNAVEEAKDDCCIYVNQVDGGFIVNGMNWLPSSMIIRRQLLLSAGLFDEDWKYTEEYECFLRMINHCPVVIVRHPLVWYRLHHSNTSKSSRLGTSLSFIKLIDRMKTQPEKYPPGAAAALERVSRDLFVRTARVLLDNGQMKEARRLLTRSLNHQFSRRGVFLWALTFLSPGAFNRALTIKRRVQLSRNHST